MTMFFVNGSVRFSLAGLTKLKKKTTIRESVSCTCVFVRGVNRINTHTHTHTGVLL